MDFKMLRLAAAALVSALLLIVAVVYATNADKIQELLARRRAQPEAETASEEETPGIQYGEQIGDNLQAFLADDSFFDERQSADEIREQDVEVVSLKVVAGPGRITVRLMNARGGLETGLSYAVRLLAAGDNGEFPEGDAGAEYRDDNRDGVVEMERLAVGKYRVTFEETDGYYAEAGSQDVNVTEASPDAEDENTQEQEETPQGDGGEGDSAAQPDGTAEANGAAQQDGMTQQNDGTGPNETMAPGGTAQQNGAMGQAGAAEQNGAAGQN